MPSLHHPTMLVERVTTRDTQIDEPDGGWTSRPCAPPGDGWRIADASHDYKTVWRRIRLVEVSEALRIEAEARRS